MNIFDHLIKDNQIAGAGPLMMEFTTDQSELALYQTRRYFFEMHFVAHTAVIKSNWFRVQGVENAEEEKNKMKAWREQYFVHRSKIARLIGEGPEPNGHVGNVKMHSKDLKALLNEILTGLQAPASKKPDDINVLIQRIFQEVDYLSDLACK